MRGEVWILLLDEKVVSVHETAELAEVAWGEWTEQASTDDDFKRAVAGALVVKRYEVEIDS